MNVLAEPAPATARSAHPDGRDDPERASPHGPRSVLRGAGAWLPLAGWATLIVCARLVGERLYRADPLVRIGNPPLVGSADLHVSPWIAPAVAFGAAALAWGPALSRRLAPMRLLGAAYAAALAWPLLLAGADGPRAIAAPLSSRYEYLHDVDRVGSPGRFLSQFTDQLPTYVTHVKGHPPGMLLLLAALDRIGLGGAGVATAVVLLVAALAAPAALVALREVAGEAAMRTATPFVALMPAAVWVGTSADALFMGVGACGVALVVLATARSDRRGDALALAGGLLLGLLLALTYGGVPLAAVPLAVALHRRRARPLLLTAAAAAAVLLALALGGFRWLDGLHATRELYAAGVASRRPYLAFVLIDLGALAVATGPALAVGLARLLAGSSPGLRRGAGGAGLRLAPPTLARPREAAPWLLPLGALAAVALASLSGLSRGETERIWLPFMPWLLLAGCGLSGQQRRWLAAQLAVALALQIGIRSPW